MSIEDLEDIDPLPLILALLKTIRTSPENATQLAADSAKLKNLMKRARAGADAIQDSNLSLNDQEEIIKILQARLKKKR